MDGGARQEPKDEEKRSRGISGHPPDGARGQRGFPRRCERPEWTRTHAAGLGSVRGVAGPREGSRRGRSGARARPAGLAAGDLPGGGDLDDVGRPRLSRFKLRFEGPDLEQQFLLAYRAAARPWIRMSLVVALSTVLGFTVIDHWLLVGPRLARPAIWRFGLQLPLVLIMMVLTAPRLYLRWYQPAIQAAAPLFGVGTLLMAVEATPAQLPLVAARLLLAAFYFYIHAGTHVLGGGAYQSAADRRPGRDLFAVRAGLRQLDRRRRLLRAGARQPRGVRRTSPARRGRHARRTHGAAQSRRARGTGADSLATGAGRGACGVRDADRRRSLQGLQRLLRSPGGRSLSLRRGRRRCAAGGRGPEHCAQRLAHAPVRDRQRRSRHGGAGRRLFPRARRPRGRHRALRGQVGRPRRLVVSSASAGAGRRPARRGRPAPEHRLNEGRSGGASGSLALPHASPDPCGMNALSVRGLTKTYRNGVQALKGVDLEVERGDFFALLGPNGAGKTTLIGIITSLVNKSAGEARVFGHDIDRELEAAKACIGVVPQELNFNMFETPYTIVVNQAGFYGIPRP